MANLSIIIPYLKEPYLDKTIESLTKNATGKIEVLAMEGLNGMRSGINAGLAKATGDYIMKCDAHCVFAPGYDKIIEDCQENWLMIPRRYSLLEEPWDRDINSRIRDYHYLSFLGQSSWGLGIYPIEWRRRGRESFDIDDTMTFQGSCWIANRKYFMEHVGFLDDRRETYGPYSDEPLEVGLKYWLGGGEVKVNKKTWYAHLRKTMHHYNSFRFSRRGKRDQAAYDGHTWGAKHWLKNEEPNMIHPFSWLIEKFWPVPSWPENWQEEIDKIYGN